MQVKTKVIAYKSSKCKSELKESHNTILIFAIPAPVSTSSTPLLGSLVLSSIETIRVVHKMAAVDRLRN